VLRCIFDVVVGGSSVVALEQKDSSGMDRVVMSTRIFVRKLHFSNIPSVSAPNQCLCGSKATVFERVF